MGFNLDSGFLKMTDLETGKEYDFGEITSLELKQDSLSCEVEPSRKLKGFASAYLSCDNAKIFNQELFNELCDPLMSSEFTIECETPILIQARWHKKARIRKKWLKRYGYKEDNLNTVMKAKYGEFNTKTGECDIEVESVEYIFKPYQLQREVR